MQTEMSAHTNPFHALGKKVKEKELIFGVCRVCVQEMSRLEATERWELPILDQMIGHLSL